MCVILHVTIRPCVCHTACNNEAMCVCVCVCVCVSLVMDIRVSPHRDIEAFKELLDEWVTEAGPGCSKRFIQVHNINNYYPLSYSYKEVNTNFNVVYWLYILLVE